MKVHYFVLEKDTELTLCVTEQIEVAEFMVANYPNCFYRIAIY